MNKKPPKVCFIVSLFNNACHIQKTLLSILHQGGGFPLQIIVIDDGSKDSSPEIVQRLVRKNQNIKLITQKHQGQAAALNRALAETRDADFIAFVEADVEIAPDWLSQNLKQFRSAKTAGVGGLLKPFPSDNWLSRLTGYEVEYKMESQDRSARHLTSAAVVYQASLFLAGRRFWESLKNSSFDFAFNLNLLNAGFCLVYNPKATAYHHYKSRLGAFLKRVWAYVYYRPYIGGEASYPYDNMIKIQSLLLALVVLTLPIFYILRSQTKAYYLLIAVGFLLLLYTITILPPMVWTVKHKKDTVVLLYPLIGCLRNLVALAAAVVGLFNYSLNKTKNNEKAPQKF